jgi:hypothetical protein
MKEVGGLFFSNIVCRFRLSFDNHGEVHPLAEQQSPCLLSYERNETICSVVAKSTRKMRSLFVHTGRFTCRLSMIRCCRQRACSAMSSDLLRPRSAKVPSGNEELSGLVQRTQRAQRTFTEVPTSRLRRERITVTNQVWAVRLATLTSAYSSVMSVSIAARMAWIVGPRARSFVAA